jgi:hypothetical protein
MRKQKTKKDYSNKNEIDVNYRNERNKLWNIFTYCLFLQ